MLKGIPPTKLPNLGLGKFSCFLIAFVNGFEGLYDSVVAKACNKSCKDTLMFKLLTICGTVLKANQRSSTRITWIE